MDYRKTVSITIIALLVLNGALAWGAEAGPRSPWLSIPIAAAIALLPVGFFMFEADGSLTEDRASRRKGVAVAVLIFVLYMAAQFAWA